MARYPSSSGASYSFGPGGMTPAVKLLVIINVVMFVLNLIVPTMTLRLGLEPRAVFEDFALWQPITYMFLHSTSGVGHVLINMLSLWMFGTELERTWGTRFFTKYYVVTGVGAAATTLLLAPFIDGLYYSVTVGASGAIFGLWGAVARIGPDGGMIPLRSRRIRDEVLLVVWLNLATVGLVYAINQAEGGGPSVAWEGHVGGFLFGLFAMPLLAPPTPPPAHY